MHAMLMLPRTAVALPGEHTIGYLLLLRRQRGVERFGCSDDFVQASRTLGHALLRALETLDRVDVARIRATCSGRTVCARAACCFELRSPFLNALVHRPCLFAQHAG